MQVKMETNAQIKKKKKSAVIELNCPELRVP